MEQNDKQEILEAISAFAEQVDAGFDAIDRRFDGVDQRFLAIDQRFVSADKRVDGLESRLGRIEATMVTKSYLDGKRGDLKGDMVALVRKEDQKMNRLIGILAEKTVVTPTEAKDVLSFRPFP